MLSRFHLIPERNGQTDGRTDRQICYINIARQYARAITIKSKSEYASRTSPNGPLNIYVADNAPEKHDRLNTVSGPHTNAICKLLSGQC